MKKTQKPVIVGDIPGGIEELEYAKTVDTSKMFSGCLTQAEPILQSRAVYNENDSKVGNLARQLRKFFVWSERPLCKHKARVKTKNVLHS